MKKAFFSVAQLLAVSAWADEVGVGKGSPPNYYVSELLLVIGVLAVAGLFYIRYRRAHNKS
ncbi:hypothetical protein [Runella sp.]|uniref:hypothetical protein n=1 Tax=Runella sp. TaxID=1960881 RepID=UPI003D1074CB